MAISQRRNSPPRPYSSASSCSSTGWPAALRDASRFAVAASAPRELADRGAHPEAGVLRRRHVGPAGHGYGAHAVEELLEIDADERGRDHAEEAEGRVPAADVARVGEHGAEALVERLLLQRRALVRDRHEVVAGVLAVELPQALVEVGMEARRLSGAAGLAGDDEQRLLEVDSRLEGADGGRVRGVEDVQLEVCLLY